MIAIKCGKVITVSNKILEKGIILIDKNKIVAVGEDINIPQDAEIIDAQGKWAMPGLIDAHSHLAVLGEPSTRPDITCDVNEMCDPITPHLSIRDSIYTDDENIIKVRNAGFTTLYITPGSSNIIGGSGITVKLCGKTIEEMEIPGHEHMKMALGENPKYAYGMNNRSPYSRMAIAAMLRGVLEETRIYSEMLEVSGNDIFKRPPYNQRLESMIKVIKGEQKVRIHCHRVDDIMTAVRICEEYNLDFCLEHVTEGYKVADILKEKKVSCVIGPILFPPRKREVWETKLENAIKLTEKGLEICLTADDGAGTRWLSMHIGMLLARGLSEDMAFRAVTINPAKLLGIDDRVGSIEVGKDADISIFNGHPFSNMSLCQFTMINGVVYYNDL